jgi:hypothetical protein
MKKTKEARLRTNCFTYTLNAVWSLPVTERAERLREGNYIPPPPAFGLLHGLDKRTRRNLGRPLVEIETLSVLYTYIPTRVYKLFTQA